jgi:anthranilate/para-aminobenzoate synthase component I
VGAGIVAESDPRAEWVETLHKAQTILAALGQDAGALDR